MLLSPITLEETMTRTHDSPSLEEVQASLLDDETFLSEVIRDFCH